jgi:hypothetical protein
VRLIAVLCDRAPEIQCQALQAQRTPRAGSSVYFTDRGLGFPIRSDMQLPDSGGHRMQPVGDASKKAPKELRDAVPYTLVKLIVAPMYPVHEVEGDRSLLWTISVRRTQNIIRTHWSGHRSVLPAMSMKRGRKNYARFWCPWIARPRGLRVHPSDASVLEVRKDD